MYLLVVSLNCNKTLLLKIKVFVLLFGGLVFLIPLWTTLNFYHIRTRTLVLPKERENIRNYK